MQRVDLAEFLHPRASHLRSPRPRAFLGPKNSFLARDVGSRKLSVRLQFQPRASYYKRPLNSQSETTVSVENHNTMHFLHQILLLSNDNSHTQLPIAISNNAAALKEVYPAA